MPNGIGSSYIENDCVSLSNGMLVLEAKNVPSHGYAYRSGCINSINKFYQKYGYWEARIKTAPGQGMWMGYWSVPNDGGYPPELDFVETMGAQHPDRAKMTAWYNTNGGTGTLTMSGGDYSTSGFYSQFHTYGVVWDVNGITWYIDGVQRFKTSAGKDHFNRADTDAFYTMIELQTPNKDTLTPPDATTQWGTDDVRVYVDWARCYKLASITGIPADLNNDRVVDFKDLAILAQSWSMCTDPASTSCGPQGSGGNPSGVPADDLKTAALWHMDAAVEGKVIDDDAANVGRNNDLILYSGAAITSGGGGKFGEAMSLDGVDDYAAADTPAGWASQDSVTIDAWFKTNIASGTQVVVTAVNTWNIQLNDSDVRMDMWDDGTPTVAHTIYVRNCVQPGTWQHVTATVGVSGNMTLVVDGYTPSTLTSTGYKIKRQNAAIDVGNKAGYTRCFNGLMDELKITVPSIPGAVCGDWGYYKADFNADCYVDMKDLYTIALSWLACSTPGDPACQPLP